MAAAQNEVDVPPVDNSDHSGCCLKSRIEASLICAADADRLLNVTRLPLEEIDLVRG
jgi:hypothetical protein